MAKAVVYTRMFCPFCTNALALLKRKGVEIDEIKVGFDAAKRAEMTKRANGASTFPQIFIGDTHVGGCDDLYALDRAGGLDALLASSG